MLRFTDYYGNDVWIVPARVLFVRDGGCGSRGSATVVELDSGKTITLHDNADRVQRVIGEALNAP